MAKKIWYSTPLKFFWDELYGTQKKITPYFPDEHIFVILRNNLLKAPFAQGENSETRELVLSGLQLWREDSIGDFLHIFFLDKHLRDFLENTPLPDLDGIREYLYHNGKNKKVVYFNTKSQGNYVVYAFGLHIPYENHGYAFSLSLDINNSIQLYFSRGIDGGLLTDKFYRDLNKKEDVKSLTLSKMFRLAINTLAYMKCFPECVTEGVPRISLERNEERSDRNVTFQLSEKITDSDNPQRSKIPHFRKGHFKVLRSDYFTHKKGQIIYITETMVKGKAKTVSTSIQMEKFGRTSENENK